MEYTNIKLVLNWTEQPDTQGGLFLQPEELTIVDNTLGSTANLQAENDRLTTSAAEFTTRVEALTGQVQTLTAERDTLAAERDALQAKVDEFGRKPSGTGTNLKPAGPGEIQAGSEVPYHSNPEHGFNQAADRATQLAKAKANRDAEKKED